MFYINYTDHDLQPVQFVVQVILIIHYVDKLQTQKRLLNAV